MNTESRTYIIPRLSMVELHSPALMTSSNSITSLINTVPTNTGELSKIGDIVDRLPTSGVVFYLGAKGLGIVTSPKLQNKPLIDVFLFDDLADIVTAEKQHYSRNSRTHVEEYTGTTYFFDFWSKEINGQRKKVFGINGEFFEEDAVGYYKDLKYRFWKKFEKIWTEYRLNLLKEAWGKTITNVGFSIYTENEILKDYIVVDSKGLQIGDRRYNIDEVQTIGYLDDQFIIEHMNYSSKFFGLLQRGNKDVIPLSQLGSREVFMWFLEYAEICRVW